MDLYAPGDRVRVVTNTLTRAPIGSVGTVTRTVANDDGPAPLFWADLDSGETGLPLAFTDVERVTVSVDNKTSVFATDVEPTYRRAVMTESRNSGGAPMPEWDGTLVEVMDESQDHGEFGGAMYQLRAVNGRPDGYETLFFWGHDDVTLVDEADYEAKPSADLAPGTRVRITSDGSEAYGSRYHYLAVGSEGTVVQAGDADSYLISGTYAADVDGLAGETTLFGQFVPLSSFEVLD